MFQSNIPLRKNNIYWKIYPCFIVKPFDNSTEKNIYISVNSLQGCYVLYKHLRLFLREFIVRMMTRRPASLEYGWSRTDAYPSYQYCFATTIHVFVMLPEYSNVYLLRNNPMSRAWTRGILNGHSSLFSFRECVFSRRVCSEWKTMS